MKHLFFKMTLGVLLTGCTISNTQMTTLELHPVPEIDLVEKVQSHKADQLAEKAVLAIIPPTSSVDIRPVCTIYVPLPVPSPIRIDFKELDTATTGKEINAIALKNVKELHQQIKNYATAQQRHYSDYKKRCVLK